MCIRDSLSDQPEGTIDVPIARLPGSTIARKMCIRDRNQADYYGYDNREQDLLQLGNRTKLIHLDLTLFFCGQKMCIRDRI